MKWWQYLLNTIAVLILFALAPFAFVVWEVMDFFKQ